MATKGGIIMVLSQHESELTEAARIVLSSKYVIALIGAGLSVESGIPPFRGPGGLWTKFGEPDSLGYERFLQDPKKWWEMGLLRHIITQNVDNLHRAAGSNSLSEIHGNMYKLRCINCNWRWDEGTL